MPDNTQVGHKAEEVTAKFLIESGYQIVDRNWRTKTCELDIIAQKGGCIYIVEVKYRKTSAYGIGFDYITSNKLRRLNHAIEKWTAMCGWSGQIILCVASVSGKSFDIEFRLQT